MAEPPEPMTRGPQHGGLPRGDGIGSFGILRGEQLAKQLGASLLVVAGGVVTFRGLAEVERSAPTPTQTLDEAERLFFAPTGSTPEIVFLAVAWLLATRLGALWHSRSSPSPVATVLACALGALTTMLCLWSYRVQAFDLLVPALSLALLSGALAFGGFGAMRNVLLPSLLLLFAFPIPAILVNRLLWPLQMMTAEVATNIVRALGVAATRSGDYILTREHIFQVIEACAGLRMLETLLLTAVLYAALFYRCRLQATLLVLLTPSIALAVNWFRVAWIVLVPESATEEWAHTVQGLVMIIAGVLLIAAVDAALVRFLPGEKEARNDPAGSERSRGTGWSLRPIVAFGTAIVLLGLATIALPRWEHTRPQLTSLTPFPTQLGEWKAEVRPKDQIFLGTVDFHQSISRTYVHPDHTSVELLVGTGNPFDRSTHILTPKLRVPGAGWQLVEQEAIALGPEEYPAWSVLARRANELSRVYHWYWGLASFGSELARSVFALDRRTAGPVPTPVVVRISTRALPDQRVRARERLDEFGRLVDRALRKNGFGPEQAGADTARTSLRTMTRER